jgi:hypothetical protein
VIPVYSSGYCFRGWGWDRVQIARLLVAMQLARVGSKIKTFRASLSLPLPLWMASDR